MLLTKQVVQVQNICQWAVTTWTKSRGSFYVTVRVKLARYVCNSESKWKLLDEVENTICTCIKARKGNDPILHRVSNTVQSSILCNTGYCNLHHVHRFQIRDLYKKRKASSEQKKTQRSFCLRLVYISIRTNWRYNANVTPQSDCQWYGTNLLLNTFLPGLSKGKARVEIPASFFFFVELQIAVKFLNTHERRSDACLTFWLISTWHGVMAEEERFIRAKSAQILCIIRSKRIQIMHKAFAVDSR